VANFIKRSAFIIATLIVHTSAFADICQINSDTAITKKAVQVIQQNYSNPNEINLMLASPLAGSPKFDPVSIVVKDVKPDGAGPFMVIATLVPSGTKIWLDLGFTYYLDQQTKKFTNLGITSNCSVPKLISLSKTLP
jgi:hypothetical protein